MAKEVAKGYAARQNMLSIVIPTRNRPQLLEEALASTIFPWPWPVECIVSQNDSLDLAPLKARFPAIQWHRWSEDLSMAEHWNRAVGLASMPLVMLLCDDDLLVPSGVVGLVDQLKADPRARIAAGGRREFRLHPPLERRTGPSHAESLSSEKSLKRFVLSENFIGPPSAVVFRREGFLGFPSSYSYATDAAAWVLYLAQGGKLILTSEQVCHFRLHDSNATERAVEEHLDLVEVNQLRLWCASKISQGRSRWQMVAATIFAYRIIRRIVRILGHPHRWPQWRPFIRKLSAPSLWPQMPESDPTKTS